MIFRKRYAKRLSVRNRLLDILVFVIYHVTPLFKLVILRRMSAAEAFFQTGCLSAGPLLYHSTVSRNRTISRKKHKYKVDIKFTNMIEV
jgi:cytochrome c oxidase assembly factor CtaG